VNVRRGLCTGLLLTIAFAFGPVARAHAQSPVTSESDASSAPSPTDHEARRWVMLEPGWLPIVTAGYRLMRRRARYLGIWEANTTVEHALTTGVLLPVIASGSATSRARLALGLGMGLDRTKLEESSAALGSTTTWILTTYAQIGAVLRVSRGTWGWLASAVWTPGRTVVGIQGERLSLSGRGAQGWERSAARGRLTFGVVARGIHVGLLVGGAYWSGDFTGTASRGESNELELGLHVGSGW
jgi:hypothetical protein